MDSVFGVLLAELSKILDTPLKPDHLNSCILKYEDGTEIQLEVDREDTRLLMGGKIGAIPPGRFRQDLLEQALKANALPPPQIGIFAFPKKRSELYLYANFRLKDLTAPQIADYLVNFVPKVREWRSALAENRLPELTGKGKTASTGMFGLAS